MTLAERATKTYAGHIPCGDIKPAWLSVYVSPSADLMLIIRSIASGGGPMLAQEQDCSSRGVSITVSNDKKTVLPRCAHAVLPCSCRAKKPSPKHARCADAACVRLQDLFTLLRTELRKRKPWLRHPFARFRAATNFSRF